MKVESNVKAQFSAGFFVKLTLVAIINALGVYALMAAWHQESMVIFFTMLVGLIAIDYVYFSRRAIAAKYLLPGVIFLLVYQVFVIGYTGFVAFTNYGDGHNSTKQDAIARSEEHTSELQSRGHLVCRLLLEKKKKDKGAIIRLSDMGHYQTYYDSQ